MSRSLYVLRHAKAEGSAPQGGDHERALKRRGRKAARAVGRFLTSLGEEPELVLCSTALRARESAELAHEEGGWSAPIELCREIYEAEAATLLALLRARAGGAGRVLLVGHQPGLSRLIRALEGNEPEFPTAALARLDFTLRSWKTLRERTGTLRWLHTPEALERELARAKRAGHGRAEPSAS